MKWLVIITVFCHHALNGGLMLDRDETSTNEFSDYDKALIFYNNELQSGLDSSVCNNKRVELTEKPEAVAEELSEEEKKEEDRKESDKDRNPKPDKEAEETAGDAILYKEDNK